MKFPQFPRRLYLTAVLGIGVLWGSPSVAHAAALFWNGGGANDLWSNPLNWGSNTLANGDDATFTLTDAAVNNSTINNIVNQDYSLNSLAYTGNSSSQWQNTQINSGVTLTLGGATGVLSLVNATAASAVQATISGDGTLAISQTGGVIQIGQGATGVGNIGGGTLDMSGLANFSATMTGGTFRVGSTIISSTGSVASTAYLAKTSSITTGTVSVGGDTGASAANLLKLGSVENTLNVNTLNVGSAIASTRGNGAVSFTSGTGTLKLRAQDGIARTTVNLANTATSASGTLTASVDLTGHSVDLLISALTISRRTVNGTYDTQSTFSFDTGTLDVTTIDVANLTNTGTGVGSLVSGTLNLGSSGSTGTSTIGNLTLATSARNISTSSATATLNVAGGSHTVSGNITMSNTSASALATSTLNLTGGTLKVHGNIAEGTASGTSNSTITLNGGTLDMDAGSITVDTFNLQSGTLQNLAEFNGGAALTKTTAGTLTLAGANSYHGNTLVSTGSLILADNASMTFYVGANGVTNSISGTGTLLLDGDFVFNLSGAAALDGNSWQIVNVGTLSETFSGTFTVQGFTKQGSVWSSGNYQFSELTGALSYLTVIPEPSIGMLMGLSVLLLTTLRRKRS